MMERTLSNGVRMPAIGMGTYPLFEMELRNAVEWGYNAGCRLFDTADNYYNEPDLGAALTHIYGVCGAHREDLFLVSKLSDELYRPGTLGGGTNKGVYFWKSSPLMGGSNAVRRVVDEKVSSSLKSLKTDYLDLLLMHWPYPDFFEEIWFEMERMYKEGRVRAIGVCNCRERHFETLRKSADIFPMVNQFETSPLNTKTSLVDYCLSNNIHTMVYSPLMSLRHADKYGYGDLLSSLAEKYGKNSGQIVLRFNIQRCLIPIPKSANRSRVEANMNVFDFELTAEEMAALAAKNVDLQYLPESRSCPGL